MKLTPARYLEPPIPAERADAVWERIREKASNEHSSAKPRRRAAFLASAATLAAAAAVVFFVRRSAAPHAVAASGLSISTDGDAQTFQLADGAELALSPASRVTVLPAQTSEQRVTIEKGSAQFRVKHNPEHRFIVRVGSVEVIDTGTVFTVAREGDAADGSDAVVRVSVTSGDVIVRANGENPRQLHAGESLTTRERLSEKTVEMPQEMGEIASAQTQVKAPTASKKIVARAVPVDSAAAAASAKSLLADATSARQAGNSIGEAQALDTLRKQFPNDPRAPVAAFELGRIRMDQLGDKRGALEALRQAILLGPHASFREDAEARIVTLLDGLGDASGCHSARESFLSKYPSSVHRDDIQTRCP